MNSSATSEGSDFNPRVTFGALHRPNEMYYVMRARDVD